MTFAEVKQLIAPVEQEIIAWRRYLHQHPEPSFEEKETTRFLAGKMEEFGIPYTVNPGGTGLVAELAGTGEGPTVAFRADIDALTMEEKSGVPFSSQNPGVMHACGHDSHTAILLGFARVMSQHRELVKGKIKFIFQHAEELMPGGAKSIVDSGILDDVDCFYGLHIQSPMDAGQVGYCYGPMTAAPDKFNIKILGRGGHAARAFDAVDPIVVAGHAIVAIQSIVSRMINATDQGVISICQVNGGTAFNVIPDTVTMSGTVRTFSDEVQATIVQKMHQVLKGVCDMFGAAYELDYIYGYPALINFKEETDKVVSAIRGLGYEAVEVPPTMGGEDFSYYLRKNRGAFFNLGGKDPAAEGYYPHHNPKFTLDESHFKAGAELFLSLYLMEQGELEA